jgi:type IV secretory pathway protease TraF
MRGRAVTLSVAAAAIAMLCFSGNASSARLVWNTTASAPVGLYSIEQGIWRVGDRVAVRPSASLAEDLDRRGILPLGKLLIKRVAAGRGDTVCRDGERVTVNGSLAAIAKVASRTAEALPSWGGCRRLSTSDVLLLGDTPDSYDGRYFGVTSAEEVLGRVGLLIGK